MMERNVSKFTALFLVLLLTLSLLGTSVFAIGSDEKGTITVSGVEDGVTVTAYQLMTVNYDYDKDSPVDPEYVWVDAVADWLKTNYPAYENIENFNNTVSDSDIAAFYDKLSAAIKSGDITLAEAGTGTGSCSIGGLEMGNYLILIENGMKVYRPSAVNLVPAYQDGAWTMTTPAMVNVKASEPAIDKTINETVNDGHPVGVGANAGGADNANIGGTVTFDLRSDIPQYPENATAKGYKVSDKLSDGLTLDKTSIKVFGDDSNEPLTEGYEIKTDAGLTNEAGKDVTFIVTFDYEKIKQYSKIHIRYNATLNAGAVIGTPGNPNTAYLDYNNNPYSGNSWKTKDDEVKVYSYGIDVSKTDKSSGAPLSGAEFTLSANKDGSSPIKFILVSEGVYRAALSGEADSVETLSVGASADLTGKLTLTGLDAGTYYLTETKAPASYNKLSGPVEIQITDSDWDGGVNVTIENAPQDIDSGLVPVTVPNGQGFELPTTGGAGTILFATVGVLLMGAGLLLFRAIGRKHNRTE